MARMCGRSGDGRLEDKRDRWGGDHNAFEEAYGDEEATGHDPAKRDKKKHVNSREMARNERKTKQHRWG